MNINNFWTKIFGIFGILGGITLFSGDMLFYYDPLNSNLFENMGNASDSRIIYSAVTALFAAWFYMFGVVHVYQALNHLKLL
jgi:cell division protein FtsX